jgi:uncharacterized protein YcfJ
MEQPDQETYAKNLDPLTGEPGSHPVSTGAGAITGGLLGAAAGGLVGGPVGSLVGIGVGAFAGGLGGHKIADAIDETDEENHWRREHSGQPYGPEADYELYHEAYRVGYRGAIKYPRDARYEDIEADLAADYGAHGAGLPWDKAHHATRAAWERARARLPKET